MSRHPAEFDDDDLSDDSVVTEEGDEAPDEEFSDVSSSDSESERTIVAPRQATSQSQPSLQARSAAFERNVPVPAFGRSASTLSSKTTTTSSTVSSSAASKTSALLDAPVSLPLIPIPGSVPTASGAPKRKLVAAQNVGSAATSAAAAPPKPKNPAPRKRKVANVSSSEPLDQPAAKKPCTESTAVPAADDQAASSATVADEPAVETTQSTDMVQESNGSSEPPAEEKPKPPRRPRGPRKKPAETESAEPPGEQESNATQARPRARKAKDAAVSDDVLRAQLANYFFPGQSAVALALADKLSDKLRVAYDKLIKRMVEKSPELLVEPTSTEQFAGIKLLPAQHQTQLCSKLAMMLLLSKQSHTPFKSTDLSRFDCIDEYPLDSILPEAASCGFQNLFFSSLPTA